MSASKKIEGVGLGLRHDLAKELLAERPEQVRWLEVHPENYVDRGGIFQLNLDAAKEHWALLPHGLTLGFGTTDSYDAKYVGRLKAFLRSIDAPFYSDHICFPGVEGVFLHDLLPLPMNRSAIDNAIKRLGELQDMLEMPIALENVSYYANPAEQEMDEPTFLLEVLEGADCKMLLDVNNIFVNSINHHFDPKPFIDQIPAERVAQIHVAGHLTTRNGQIIDTHGEPMCEGVYDLLEYTLERMGPIPVLLERDQNIPPLDVILQEVDRLTEIYDRSTALYHSKQAADSQATPELTAP